MKVLVLGAGVIGVSTALVLARRGVEVIVIEQHAHVAAETSQANGGLISPGHAEPWNAPGIGGKVLRWLGRRDAPFRLRLSALPGMGRWGLEFLHGSRRGHFIRHARDNTRLAVYSRKCLETLRDALGIEYQQFTGGSLKVVFDHRDLEETIRIVRLIDDPGVEFKILEPDEAIALEPALAPVRDQLAGVLHFPGNESGDAEIFTRKAAELARAAGANFKFDTTVVAIECGPRGFRRVKTSSGEFSADACVVALGCASPALLRPLGVRAPIYPVKGYSATVHLKHPEIAPRMPILDASSRFVVSRLGNRLRIAGTAEFAGYDQALDEGRARSVVNSALRLLPALADEIGERTPEYWTGLRPMTPDGPPLLGKTRHHNLLLNTGHGSLGWTQACGSAEIIADLLGGESPAIDLAGLEATRWS